MKNPKSILITGASSGIGAALAKEYAASGITLFISGRNRERLSGIEAQCKAVGASVHAKIIDCRNEDEMKCWIKECDQSAPLDLVIANAGISSGFKLGDDLAAHTKNMFDTNVFGVFNTVHPTLERMQQRKAGQIAILSSIAGYRGMPSSPSYSTAKVTVKAYGEALRGYYHATGIEVNVVCPGFVRSRITDKNKFSMPFFMEAGKAAKIIRRGLARNKGLIAFPWQMRLIMGAMVRFMPSFLLERLLRSLPYKK